MHDLITYESKVQVVVSLGSYEVLFALGCHDDLSNDMRHVLLQSENILELEGITIKVIDGHSTMDAFSIHDLSILPPGWDVGPLQDIKKCSLPRKCSYVLRMKIEARAKHCWKGWYVG